MTHDSDVHTPSAVAALAGLAIVFLVSRGIVIAVALTVEAMYPIQVGSSASSASVARSLTSSDAFWYLRIAETGYHAEPLSNAYHDYAFFPMYPAVVRVMSYLFGSVVAAGLIVSNASFVLAAILMERMGRPILGPIGSVVGVALVALAPGAVAFSMAYPESLFLALTLAAVAAADRSRWPLMAALFAMACLTRLPGVILVVPLAIVIGQRIGWRVHRTWLWLVAGPAALAAYFAYLWRLTGDPLAYPHAQAAWNSPVDTVGPPGLPAIPPAVLVLLLVVVMGFYLFQLIYFRTSRVPVAHLAYAVATVAVLALTVRIVSTARWLAVVWPFAWVMVSRRSRVFVASTLVASTVAYSIFAFLHFTTLLAP